MNPRSLQVVQMAVQLIATGHMPEGAADLGDVVDHVIDAVIQAEMQLAHPINCPGCPACEPPGNDPESVH